jgi:hypothetical protein
MFFFITVTLPERARNLRPGEIVFPNTRPVITQVIRESGMAIWTVTFTSQDF